MTARFFRMMQNMMRQSMAQALPANTTAQKKQAVDTQKAARDAKAAGTR